MSRLTEYTVVSGRRTSWRLAGPPTSTPSGVNATMDGRSPWPSASGITRGSPVFSSTYATRLLVVPRSMPTIRDMSVLTLSERGPQVVDHRAEIRPGRQRVLECGDEAGPLGRDRRVPRLAERPGPRRLDLHETHGQLLALGPQRLAAARVETAGLSVLERLLDLEHLLEQLGRRLGLHPGAH